MALIEFDRPVSLSLLAKNWTENKEQSKRRSAQFSASLRRSGRSPALPYPPHEWLESTISFYSPFKGDISTLQNWGRFYFALTGVIITSRKLEVAYFYLCPP
jgi:hypothetical protein